MQLSGEPDVCEVESAFVQHSRCVKEHVSPDIITVFCMRVSLLLGPGFSSSMQHQCVVGVGELCICTVSVIP